MPIVRRSDCVPLPTVVCPVVAVVMQESITTATKGQTTIGSGAQSDRLTMGIKIPETC